MPNGYSKFKRRTGGFSTALAPVFDALKQLEERENKQEFFNNLLGLYNRYQKKLNQRPQIGAVDLQDITLSPSEPETTQIGPEQVRTPGIADIILPDAVTEQDRFKAGEEILRNFQQAVIPSLLSSDIPETGLSRINLLGEMLGRQIKEPEPQKPVTRLLKPVIRLLGEGEYQGRKGVKYGYIQDGKEIVTEFDPLDSLGKQTRGEEGFPDVNKEFGLVNEGIRRLSDLTDAQYIKEPGPMGETLEGYKITDGEGNVFYLSEDELTRRKDLIAQQYIAPLTRMVNKRELRTAIEAIKEASERRLTQISKRKNLRERFSTGETTQTSDKDRLKNIKFVIDKFIEANPDYSSERPYLLAYFKFLL